MASAHAGSMRVGDFAAAAAEDDEDQEEAARRRAHAQVQQRLSGGDFRWIVLEAADSPTGSVVVADAYAAPTLGGRTAAAAQAWRARAESQRRRWLRSEASLRQMREEPLRRLFEHRRAAITSGESLELAWGRLPRQMQGLLTPACALQQSGDLPGAHLALSQAETAIACFYGFVSIVALEEVRELLHGFCGLRIGGLCGDADTLARGKRSAWSRPAERPRVESVASKVTTQAIRTAQADADKRAEWTRRVLASKGTSVKDVSNGEDIPELKSRMKDVVEHRRKQQEERQRKAGERRARAPQDGTAAELERKETEEERRKRMWRQAQAWMKEFEEEDQAASNNRPSTPRVQAEFGSNRQVDQSSKSTRRLRMEERRRRERGITSGAESDEAWTDSSFSPPTRKTGASRLSSTATEVISDSGTDATSTVGASRVLAEKASRAAPREVENGVPATPTPSPHRDLPGSPAASSPESDVVARRKQRMAERRRRLEAEAGSPLAGNGGTAQPEHFEVMN